MKYLQIFLGVDIEQNLPHAVIEDNTPDEVENFPQAASTAACNAGIEDPCQAPMHPWAMIIENVDSIDDHNRDIGTNDMDNGNDEDDVSIPQQIQEDEDVDHVPKQHQEQIRTRTGWLTWPPQ